MSTAMSAIADRKNESCQAHEKKPPEYTIYDRRLNNGLVIPQAIADKRM